MAVTRGAKTVRGSTPRTRALAEEAITSKFGPFAEHAWLRQECPEPDASTAT